MNDLRVKQNPPVIHFILIFLRLKFLLIEHLKSYA